MRIVCFHLYNDYSGSPKVLKMVLQRLLDKGYKVDLITSRGGVLDELKSYPNLKYTNYFYHFSKHYAVVMARYICTQIYTFCLAFRYLFQHDTVFYINTLQPIGPALAGRLMRKRVVYHYHENAFIKSTFYRMLCSCMQHLASEIICVSAYQRSFLKRRKHVDVIPNAIPQEFVEQLRPDINAAFERKRILMLGSLKIYKGTLDFVELAHSLPQYDFKLVINDTQNDINCFKKEQKLKKPSNLTAYPRQSDVTRFYNRASVVLNLSHKDLFIETFGLTALEAMADALPVIVPTVGGIAEMVEDGVNGYKIDVRDLDKIAGHIKMMLSDRVLYSKLAHNALSTSIKYNEEKIIDAIASKL